MPQAEFPVTEVIFISSRNSTRAAWRLSRDFLTAAPDPASQGYAIVVQPLSIIFSVLVLSGELELARGNLTREQGRVQWTINAGYKGGRMKRVTRLMLVLFISLVAAETTAFAMQEISWTTQADSMRGRNGQRVSYFCPPGGNISDRLWGSTLYTDDSSICTAAVHAGIIDAYNGGDVTIEIRPGAGSYLGSRRNGVSSKGYGSFHGSFVFVAGGQRQSDDRMMNDYDRRGDRERALVPGVPGIPVPLPGGLGSLDVPGVEVGDHRHQHQSTHAIQIEWGTTVSAMRGRNGDRVRYFCPPGGALGSLWGSGTYTDDSSVCTAAVHAGLITTYSGGEVLIEIRPGARSYQGSRRNGVSSQSYGSFDGSFFFIR